MNRLTYSELEHLNNGLSEHAHMGLKPVLEGRVNTTTTLGYAKDTATYYYEFTKRAFGEHLVDIKGEDYQLIVDPQFNFSSGSDFNDTEFNDTARFFTNTRGFSVSGDIGSNLSFQTRFYENLSTLPAYLTDFINVRRTVPGQGRPKVFRPTAFDYAWAAGKVSWSPVEELNIQFGSDRHHVGHGYRSVLLSDNAFNYPFIKASALLFKGKVQYSSIFAKLTSFNRLPTGQSSEDLFYWKRASYHHLSIDLGRLQLALFESTHWQTIDSIGVRPMNPLEWNPVIGVNTASNGFESEHEQLLGLDARFKITDDFYVYGQIATDELSTGRKAFQLGGRLFDVAGSGVNAQVEYNSADPFMYTSEITPLAYTHFGQELAHPFGADFSELVVILEKRTRKWYFTAKLNMATTHTDSLATQNFGNDLYKSAATASDLGEPIEQQLTFVEGKVSYILNPNYNMLVSLGYRYRDLTNAPQTANSSFLYLAWETALFNKYYDF